MSVLERISTAEITEEKVKEFVNTYLLNSKNENHTLGLKEKDGYIEMYIERNSSTVNEEKTNE